MEAGWEHGEAKESWRPPDSGEHTSRLSHCHPRARFTRLSMLLCLHSFSAHFSAFASAQRPRGFQLWRTVSHILGQLGGSRSPRGDLGGYPLTAINSLQLSPHTETDRNKNKQLLRSAFETPFKLILVSFSKLVPLKDSNKKFWNRHWFQTVEDNLNSLF